MVIARKLLIGMVYLLLAACGGSDNYYPDYPSGPSANVQFINASPDAPPLNVLIDGQVAIYCLDYTQGTGEWPLPIGMHTIEIQALTPGTPTTVLGPTSVNFLQNTDYVIVAEGPVAGISAETFTHTLSEVASTSTRVQVLHAAPQAPSVAVYLTAPGADLTTSTPLGTVSFKGALGPTDVASGSYEIRVTPAGATTPVVYDSGTITLNGGADLVLTAVQNTGPGAAPIFLAVTDAYGNDWNLYDIATPASVRVVHDSANAPAVDVAAVFQTTAVGEALPPLDLASNLSYTNSTAYEPVFPTGNYAVSIAASSAPQTSLVTQNAWLNAGVEYSLYAVNPLSTLGVLKTRDDRRRYATQARLRIVQGSPTAGSVDVYVVAPGTNIASVAPNFPSLPYLADTGFVSYAAGSYAVTITPAGSKTPSIAPVTVTLADDGVYTAVARDATGGGTPLGWIALDDLVL